MRCGKVSVFYLLPCLAFCYSTKVLSLMKIAGLTTLVAGIVLINQVPVKRVNLNWEVNHGAV